MEHIRLGDICEILNGFSFKSERYVNSGIRVIRISNVQKGYIEDNTPAFYPLDTPGLEKYMLREGDLLLSLTGNVGRVAILHNSFLPAALNQRVACIRMKSNLIEKVFLFHLLNSDTFEQRCIFSSRGVAQKNMSTEWLKEYEIPLYSKIEQKRIVRILDQVSSVQDARQKQLRALDELVKARFIEMFGDPIENPKHWNSLTFRNASIRLSDGPFGSNLKSEHYTNHGIRVIRLGNIGVGSFINEDKSFISKEHYEKLNKYTCKAGEIVIGTLGEPNLRACIVPNYVGIAINKADCVHFIPKKELLNTEFACQYINCPETLVLAASMVHGQTRTRISSGQIAELPIFAPPMDLQRQFATFVRQVDQLKSKLRESLTQTETLFNSLMQQYFG